MGDRTCGGRWKGRFGSAGRYFTAVSRVLERREPAPARGATRGREVVTRIALGASRGRITDQLLIEGIVISLAGGLLGIAAAPAVSAALLSFLPQDVARASLTSNLDTRVLLFTFLVCIATGALCGSAPALQAGKLSLVTALRERSPSIGGVRLRRALVIGDNRLHAHPLSARVSSADGLPPAREGTGVVRERSPSDVSGRHSEERIQGFGGRAARAQAAAGRSRYARHRQCGNRRAHAARRRKLEHAHDGRLQGATGDGSPGPLQSGLARILLDAGREADRGARLRGAWLDRLRRPEPGISFGHRQRELRAGGDFGDASPIGHAVLRGTARTR